MTTWVEGERSYILGAAAEIVQNDREIAGAGGWAAQHVIENPAFKYVLGRFVEADRANSNRQLFRLEGLQMARPSITHAPMNMNHSARRVVGAYVATDLIYPTGDLLPESTEEAREISQEERDKKAKTGAALPDGSFPISNEQDLRNAIKALGRAKDQGAARAHIIKRARALGLTKVLPADWVAQKADDGGVHPYVEALGVMWKYYFPEEYALIEDAYAQGRLYFSMECVPRELQCAGDDGCGAVYAYDGRQSPTYCAHLNEGASDKLMINPHFTGGALLVPPVQPGWSNADVHSLVAKRAAEAEAIYQSLQQDLDHLEPRDWEALMGEILVLQNR